MPNNTNRVNQPPTGRGKNQPRHTDEARKPAKRSEVAQAQRNHPELNVGDRDETVGRNALPPERPRRRKAGR
jgi:hypothetical protein